MDGTTIAKGPSNPPLQSAERVGVFAPSPVRR